jgi:hypothetical protein
MIMWPAARSLFPYIFDVRHRVRQRWREWEQIGASGKVVYWIRHGVPVKIKRGLRPLPFNHVVSMLDATPSQLSLLTTELPRSKTCKACERGHTYHFVLRTLLVPKPCII